jgi:hypothetical protein
MNPDLEALIKAYLAWRECDVSQRPGRQADYDALLEAALRNSPGVSRKVFTQGIRHRAMSFLKAQARPPTLPPQA